MGTGILSVRGQVSLSPFGNGLWSLWAGFYPFCHVRKAKVSILRHKERSGFGLGRRVSQKKSIRQGFRNSVFTRDRYRCRGCGYQSTQEKAEQELDAHYIVNRNLMPEGGYTLDNGIALCKIGNNCHLKAERNEPGFTIGELKYLIESGERR